MVISPGRGYIFCKKEQDVNPRDTWSLHISLANVGTYCFFWKLLRQKKKNTLETIKDNFIKMVFWDRSNLDENAKPCLDFSVIKESQFVARLIAIFIIVKEKIKDILMSVFYYALLVWFGMSIATLVTGFAWAIYSYTRWKKKYAK